MNLLLDTNVIIAAYPKSSGDVEASESLASELIRLANEHGHTTYIHPFTIQHDLRTENLQDKQWRIRLSNKHPKLESPPTIQPIITDKLGDPDHGSNDWVDHNMIAAVWGNAVDVLVTQDKSIIAKSKRLDMGEQVTNIEDALAMLKGLRPRQSNPMLLAKQVEAHIIQDEDPIFESLRNDYHGFDEWLAKCKLEHRTAWRIEDGSHLAALTIVKDENPAEYNIQGKTLKIGLFKVSENHPGMRYGEALLKAVFDYICANSYEKAYVTVLPKHGYVIDFFEEFGFRKLDRRTELDEFVLVKSFMPADTSDSLSSLEYHIAYGPHNYRHCVSAFVIPIRPEFHKQLFPETEMNFQLPGMENLHPFGNSIQKAYLSKGNRKAIVPGSILYFYRSGDWRKLTVVGIAEGTLLSPHPERIASYVGKRTVYPYSEIESMTSGDNSNILSILFRQARTIDSINIDDNKLFSEGILAGPPQSITQISQEGVQWIQNQIPR